MNIIQIAGHLGADPEAPRFTAEGRKVVNFKVATNSRKGGKDVTIWYRVAVWGDRFDGMMPYLKKGSAVIVLGELLEPRIWTDKEGRPQVSLEISAELLRFSPFGKSDRSGNEQNPHAAAMHTPTSQAMQAHDASDSFGGYQTAGNAAHRDHNSDDDIPF